jgi:hypothetical protein
VARSITSLRGQHNAAVRRELYRRKLVSDGSRYPVEAFSLIVLVTKE